MEEWKEFSAKTADEALTNALIQMETTSDQIEYEVVEEEKSGILGLFSKPAVIRVRKKENVVDTVKNFLAKTFQAMKFLLFFIFLSRKHVCISRNTAGFKIFIYMSLNLFLFGR